MSDTPEKSAPEQIYAEVGQRIREVRERRGITQEELACLVSLTRTSITNLEQGRQRILLHTLLDIAVALRVPVSTLLPEQDSGAELLDSLIAARTPKEQEWIRAVVRAAIQRE